MNDVLHFCKLHDIMCNERSDIVEGKYDSKKIFSYNFRRLLAQSNMSQREFIYAMGNANKTSVSQWFNGTRTPTDSCKERIAALFNVPLSELFLSPEYIESREIDPHMTVTVLGTTNNVPDFLCRVKRFCVSRPLQPFGLQVIGNCLEPYACDGDIVECKAVKGIPNKTLVLLSLNDKLSVAVLSRAENSNVFVLSPKKGSPVIVHNSPDELENAGVVCVLSSLHRNLKP